MFIVATKASKDSQRHTVLFYVLNPEYHLHCETVLYPCDWDLFTQQPTVYTQVSFQKILSQCNCQEKNIKDQGQK